MKLAVVLLLAWCGALAYAAWVLYEGGHHGWSATVPILGLLFVHVDATAFAARGQSSTER